MHTDPSFTTWAASYTIRRYEYPPPDPEHNTRHASKQIPAFGSDFVDFSARIIVRGASNTMMAFRPANLHGTTYSHRVDQYNVALTSTQRVLDAFEKALSAGGLDRKLLINVDGGDPQLYKDN